MSDKRQRFFEARMPRLAAIEAAAELGRRQPAPNFALERSAPGRGIDDALDMHGADIATNAGHADGKDVHYKTRIDAGSDHPGVGVLANFIEHCRQLWL